jgi:hypothetical protein
MREAINPDERIVFALTHASASRAPSREIRTHLTDLVEVCADVRHWVRHRARGWRRSRVLKSEARSGCGTQVFAKDIASNTMHSKRSNAR